MKLWEGEAQDLEQEAAKLFANSPQWLNAPNDLLGGQIPINLINSGIQDNKDQVRHLLRAIKHGMPS